MLFRIPYLDADEEFQEYIDFIKDAFYPENTYKNGENNAGEKYIDYLPNWKADEIPKPDKIIEEIQESIERMTENINKDKGFYIIKEEEKKSGCHLPFINRFHSFFLQRKWNEPYRDPTLNGHNLFSRDEPSDEKKHPGMREYEIFQKTRGTSIILSMLWQ
jgi:hypothetical protein